MALDADIVEKDLEKVLTELKRFGKVDIIKDLAILSLVGKQMRHMVGIASRMFSTLASVNVNIEMISQGASEINISCVVSACDAVRGMEAVHDQLLIRGALPSSGANLARGPWFY